LRYNEILVKLGSISPKSLADRLKDLERARLIKREAFAEIPPRVEYSLTKDGVELRNKMMPLMKWASSRKQNKVEYTKNKANRS
jgi:DNA-binding HxlR family transcriptional regulator